MRGAALLAVGLLFAGCFTTAPSSTVTLEPTEPTYAVREADAYWMVWIRGNQTREEFPFDPRAVCSLVFDHEVHVDAHALTYASRRYADAPESPDVVIAWDHFDEGGCPLAYGLDFAPAAAARMGHYGELTVGLEPDGTLVLDGQTRIPLGERARVAYEGRDEGRSVHGEFLVENLGTWPVFQVTRASY